MKIILDDIVCKEDLYPFTLTRSVADIRVGILTTREKWEILLDKKINTLSEVPHNDKAGELIPANILPSQKILKSLKHYKNFQDQKSSVKIEYPWHIFQNNDGAIRQDFELITGKRRSKKISPTNTVIG